MWSSGIIKSHQRHINIKSKFKRLIITMWAQTRFKLSNFFQIYIWLHWRNKFVYLPTKAMITDLMTKWLMGSKLGTFEDELSYLKSRRIHKIILNHLEIIQSDKNIKSLKKVDQDYVYFTRWWNVLSLQNRVMCIVP